MKKIITLLAVAALSLTAAHNLDARKPTLYIIGDSTVAKNNPPILGWGEAIKPMFDSLKINVVNMARGGRSARTYLNEGLWAQVRDQLQPGDFVLMGFGHNDGNPQFRGSASGGLVEDVVEVPQPDGSVEKVHTFGWYMDLFAREALEKGAQPILFSQVPWRELYDGKSKRTAFIPFFKEVAEAESVPFVDLNDLVIAKYEKMTQEEVNKFFDKDHTHTNPVGAELNAATMIEGIQALKNCKLKKYINKKYGK